MIGHDCQQTPTTIWTNCSGAELHVSLRTYYCTLARLFLHGAQQFPPRVHSIKPHALFFSFLFPLSREDLPAAHLDVRLHSESAFSYDRCRELPEAWWWVLACSLLLARRRSLREAQKTR